MKSMKLMESPIPLLTAQQMRTCDTDAITRGVPSQTLMERAAHAAIDHMRQYEATMPQPGRKVVVMCGSGNNGGDGFAMARFLAQEQCRVTVAYAGAWRDGTPDESRMSEECAKQCRLWLAAGGEMVADLPSLSGGVVIDALIGIDLHGAPRPPMDTWIRAVNECGDDVTVVAVDIPSGVRADDGAVFANGEALLSVDGAKIPLGAAVRAKMTMTMAYPKRGLVFYPGAAMAGTVHVCDIGVDSRSISPEMYLVTKEHLRLLPKRPRYANKGTFGRLAVLGGEVGLCGAVSFAGRAALRAGVGLCELISVEQNAVVLQTVLPEAVLTLLPTENVGEDILRGAAARADVAVVGCGMGQSKMAHDRLSHFLFHANGPLVVDADALNMIAADEKGVYRARLRAYAKQNTVVMTPHVGEAARLLRRSVGDVIADLPGASAALAREYGAICVLKDTRTVISDGRVMYVQNCGNSALAKGGSGDVLAGVIGAMLCLYRNESISATPTLLVSLGVLVHAMAGDRIAEEKGAYAPLARELADAVGTVMSGIEG